MQTKNLSPAHQLKVNNYELIDSKNQLQLDYRRL